jgi:hypothetical protein
LAIIVKKLLNIFAALPNCQSTGGVSIEMAKPIPRIEGTKNVSHFDNPALTIHFCFFGIQFSAVIPVFI